MTDPAIEKLISEISKRLSRIEDRLSNLEQAAKPTAEVKLEQGSLPSAIEPVPTATASVPDRSAQPAEPVIESPRSPEQVTPAVNPVNAEEKKPSPELVEKPQESAPLAARSSFAFDKLQAKIGDSTEVPAQRIEPVAPASNALESKIGSYWLNRAGLLALLIGIISLLLYSFQYFGAGIKVAFGFVLAGTFIFLARLLRFASNAWFANGLSALGWSIAFFTGYAMYYIPDLKVITLAPLEVFVLIGLAAGTMIDAIRSKSEFTACQGVTFAALSLCLATTTTNPFIGLVIIVIAASFISIRQGWYSLLLYATVVFYGTFYFVCHSTHPAIDVSLMAYLVAGWLSLHLAVFFGKKASDEVRTRLIWASTINALCASWFAPAILNSLIKSESFSGYLLSTSVLGAIYLITSKLFERKEDESLSTLHQLIGLSFLNISKWGKFTGQPNAVADIIQLGLLTTLGLRCNLKAFTWFAVLLAVVTLPEAMQNGWMIGWLAVGVYGSIAYVYRDHAQKVEKQSTIYMALSNYYIVLANIIATIVISFLDGANHAWKGVLWLLQMLVNTVGAVRTRNVYFLVVSVLLFMVNIFAWIAAISLPGNWLAILLACVALFAVAIYCRTRVAKSQEPWTANFKDAYWIFASILLAAFLWKVIPEEWFSLTIAIQSMALIYFGNKYKEQYLHYSGLAVFAVTAIRLAAYGLTAYQTLLSVALFYGFYWYCRISYLKKSEQNYQIAKDSYSILATLVLTLYLFKNVPDEWLSLAITIQAVALIYIANKYKEQYLQYSGLAIFAITVFRLIAYGLAAYQTILSVGLFYAFYLYCHDRYLKTSDRAYQLVKDSYGILATVVFTLYLSRNVSQAWLSIAVGAEAMALVTTGFLLKEKFFRISGLIVFALVIARLLFVDFASASTIARIISFIATGLMLVGSSYAYGWFSKRLIDTTADDASPQPEAEQQHE